MINSILCQNKPFQRSQSSKQWRKIDKIETRMRIDATSSDHRKHRDHFEHLDAAISRISLVTMKNVINMKSMITTNMKIYVF